MTLGRKHWNRNAKNGTSHKTIKNSNIMDATDTVQIDPQGQFGDVVKNWQDGQTYDITLSVSQTAPGKFAVLSVEENGADAEEPEPPAAPPAPVAKKTGNPAVDGMMQ